MFNRRVGRFFELIPYPLPCSVKLLVQQVQLDELIDREQIIRHELCSFFECLARFVIPFGLAIGHAKGDRELWIVRGELGLVLKDCYGIVKPIKRAISSGQEQGGVAQIGASLQQTAHRFDHLVTVTGAKINLAEQQDGIVIIRID